MKKKYNIINWALGIVFCSLGVSFCTKAGLGLSMIAAPAYILHLWAEKFLPWFSQGTSEYVFEALMLIVTCLLVRQFHWRYLLSFGVAVVSGLCIDGWLSVLGGGAAYGNLAMQIFAFAAGAVITSFGVACFFHTMLPLQVYELLVSEVADVWGKDKSKVKYIYDFCMLALALAMALLLNRSWKGIGIGTLVMTVINAPMIRFFGKWIEKVETNVR